MSASHSFPRDRIRAVLLEGVHESAVEALRSRGYTRIDRYDTALDGDDLKRAIADAHLIGIRSRTQLTRGAIEAAHRLVAIGCFCIGTNQVDVDFAAGRGVPAFNAPHSNTRSVAELVIGLTVMLMRDVFPKSLAVHQGRWPKTARGSREVRGKTMGIIGYGHIGSQVSILAEALGMNVIFFDIVDKLPLGNARRADSLTEVLLESDMVTLHVPQTAQTSGMMNQARLRSMRRGAHLINTSRGAVVDQAALAELLAAGHIAGAAVDVFPTEPSSNELALESPLRGLDNVILTPHVAGSTEEAQQKIGVGVATKLMRFSDSGATVGAVNFPELTLAPHEGAHRILHIHRNVPGVLSQINRAVAGEGINVLAQHLETRREIGYVVLDIESEGSDRLFAQLRSIDSTIRARILY